MDEEHVITNNKEWENIQRKYFHYRQHEHDHTKGSPVFMDNKIDYFAGYDIGKGCSNGAICLMKRNKDNSMELIKTYKFFGGKKWFQKLQFKWIILKLYFKYYKKIIILKEYNG